MSEETNNGNGGGANADGGELNGGVLGGGADGAGTGGGSTPANPPADPAAAAAGETKGGADGGISAGANGELLGGALGADPDGAKPDGSKDGAKGGAKPDGQAEERPDYAKMSAEDYGKAVSAALKPDESFGKNMAFDEGIVKAVLPELQRMGVTPEQFNALANAVAKAQMESGRARMEQRLEAFREATQRARETFTPEDFRTINRGLRTWFRPGGAMDYTIRNTELQNDPELLRLMKYLGDAAKPDGMPGTGDGAGGGADAPISAIWK